MRINAENLCVAVDFNGKMTLSCTVCADSADAIRSAFEDLQGKKLTASIEPWKARRSIDANAFLWVLCDGMAKKLRTTKEEVYRELVRRVGVFQIVPIRADAVDSFQRMWNGRGLGWFVDVIDDSKLDGYKKVFIYFGTSSYDSAQMACVVDEAIQEAESLGIPTIPDDVRRVKEALNG